MNIFGSIISSQLFWANLQSKCVRDSDLFAVVSKD